MNYHLAKARVVARHAGIDAEAAMDWFDRRLKKKSQQLNPTYQYGKALVYLDNRELDKAESILLKLQKQDPLNTFYLDALSDLYIYKEQPQQAVKLLNSALEKKPNNTVITVNYANALIEAGQFKQALSVLQRYTHQHPDDVIGWQLMADANGKMGNSAENLAANGEIFALRANWNKALQNFTQASQLAELGSLEQARYDARIDQLMVQRDRFLALQ